MNTQSNAALESQVDTRRRAPALMPATRPLYWSVRRELWENRSIYIAPLAVAALVVFGYSISTIGLPHRRRALMLLDAAHQQAAIERPYDVMAMMIIVTAFIVGVFYCLDALHGERRDRSILFWKSLPVSDLTTVNAKASIPLVVLPLIVFVIALAAQFFMLLLSTVILLASGLGAAAVGPQWRFFPSPPALLYGLTAIALWHAPIYAWLLLVSGWARRAAFLWALLPFPAIAAFERIAFHSTHFAHFLQYRLAGGIARAFVAPATGRPPTGSLASLDPGKFLSTPGLWIGLGAAAIFLTAAVEIRRNREPI